MLVGKIGYFDCGMVEMAVMAEMWFVGVFEAFYFELGF